MVHTRLFRAEKAIRELAAQSRRNSWEFTQLILAGTATPPDFLECMPDRLLDIRCDIVMNVGRLRARRALGQPVRTGSVASLVTIVAATPPDDPIGEYVQHEISDAWDRCWPEPYGHRQPAERGQLSVGQGIFFLAALGSPTADDFRRDIAAGRFNNVGLMRSNKPTGFTTLDDEDNSFSLDEHGRRYFVDEHGRRYFVDENGQQHCVDETHWPVPSARATPAARTDAETRALLRTM